MSRFYFVVMLLLLVSACKKGEPLANQAPETKIFLDAINLTGEDRLNSVVRLHWTGEDVDGYVRSYEISFDSLNWTNVFVQDSTFRFPISGGADTTDIRFFVRAIDNLDEKDPTPARLVVPIRNTLPTITLDATKPIPDSTWSVFSIIWTAEDLDGDETLDSVFVKLNNGAWFPVAKSTNFLTFVPENPMQAGAQNGKVYKGTTADLLNARISDVRVGDFNRLYVKVRDIAGGYSAIDSTNRFYLRRQSSDLLVIDDNSTTGAASPEVVYYPLLDAVYPAGYDNLILSGTGATVPPFWQPTFGLFLNLYDKVFWFSEGKEQTLYNSQLFMEVASLQIQNYLNQGGKLFYTLKFPGTFDKAVRSHDSPMWGYSPIDSVSTTIGTNGQARIPLDSLVIPTENSWDVLKPSVFMTGVDPFYPKSANQVLYRAQLQKSGGWQGPNSVCGKTNFTNGRTNQVCFTVELFKLNGDPVALQNVFNRILNQEFNW